jgi:hypothetical protein
VLVIDKNLGNGAPTIVAPRHHLDPSRFVAIDPVFNEGDSFLV